MRNLQHLPKADLHCHLEGSARPHTIAELAAKYGARLGDPQNFTDLLSFLTRFEEARSVIRSIDDLTRIATEFVLDQAESGAVYCEPDWAPHFYLDLEGLKGESREDRIEEIFEAVNTAMQNVANTSGIQVGHLLGASKSDAKGAIEIAKFAVRHREQNVVSFGFAGNEALAHDPFKEAAEIALEGGLLFVPHAGETRGPESIAQVLDFGANRLAHGIRAMEDEPVLKRLIVGKVACDIALSSNARLGIIADLRRHPFLSLLRAGVPVTLGTDDSLFFGSSLLNEYTLARSLGATDDELAKIATNSLEYSGAPEKWKTNNIARIEEWRSAS
jgi:adenosine deaminase